MTSQELLDVFRTSVDEVAAADAKVKLGSPESVLLTLVNGLIAIKQAEEQASQQLRDAIAQPLGGPRRV